jgi:transcriptional regulator GlxA family with amidase domain
VRRVGVVLFDQFELLDVFGPLEIIGMRPDDFEIVLMGPAAATRSTQGPAVVVDHRYAEAIDCDVALVPGGLGTRALVEDPSFLSWLADWCGRCEIVTSVCTGSGLLAAAGLLDGYRATSNKRAFNWIRTTGPQVEWVAEARWVEDRDRWTSSGVAAGMDMTLALVARLLGEQVAVRIADHIELD